MRSWGGGMNKGGWGNKEKSGQEQAFRPAPVGNGGEKRGDVCRTMGKQILPGAEASE